MGMHKSKLTSFKERSRGVTDIMLKLKLRERERESTNINMVWSNDIHSLQKVIK